MTSENNKKVYGKFIMSFQVILKDVTSYLSKHDDSPISSPKYIEYRTKTMETSPETGMHWLYKGISLACLNQHTEALKCYDEAIRIDFGLAKSAEIWIRKGNSKKKTGQFQDALKCYDEAIRLEPDSAEAWTCKGDLLNETDHEQKALECYIEAIRVNPDYIYAWFSRASLFEKAGHHLEALKCYDEVIKIKPDYPHGWIYKSLLCKVLECIIGVFA